MREYTKYDSGLVLQLVMVNWTGIIESVWFFLESVHVVW